MSLNWPLPESRSLLENDCNMASRIESTARRSGAPSYQLKVVLLGTKPVIWRRIQVPGDAKLSWLHPVLQLAMGWTNSHLHHFLTTEARYCDPRYDTDMADEGDRDETKALLAEVAPEEGVEFGYEYDFGDSWQHQITVEKILPAVARATETAICLDGARACPPEDCGGIWGYAELLKTIKNPKHPEHESMMIWLGGRFDPAAFDRDEVNTWLRQLKWPRFSEAQLRTVLMRRDQLARKASRKA